MSLHRDMTGLTPVPSRQISTLQKPASQSAPLTDSLGRDTEDCMDMRFSPLSWYLQIRRSDLAALLWGTSHYCCPRGLVANDKLSLPSSVHPASFISTNCTLKIKGKTMSVTEQWRKDFPQRSNRWWHEVIWDHNSFLTAKFIDVGTSVRKIPLNKLRFGIRLPGDFLCCLLTCDDICTRWGGAESACNWHSI